MTLPAPTLGMVPRAPSSNVLQTVAGTIPADVEWRSGIRYRETNCPVVDTWPLCPSPSDVKTEGAAGDLATFFPFTIYVPHVCDWVIPERSQEHVAEVEAQVDAATGWALSRELWAGRTFGVGEQSPSLRTLYPGEAIPFPAAQLLTASASPTLAISKLLQAYGDATHHGGGAVIHAPFGVLPFLARDRQMTEDPVPWRVSGGPGYLTGTNSGPETAAGTFEDAAAGEAFMFITGPVEYQVGPVEVNPDAAERWFDRRMNAWMAWGERQAIVRFDRCAVFATLATLPTS